MTIKIESARNPHNPTEHTVKAVSQVGMPVPVAFAGLKVMEGFIILHSVIVAPEHQRKGIGTRLVRWCLNHCQKEWPTLTVYISAVPYGTEPPDQETLFRFYEGLGFKRTPGHKFEMTIHPASR